jgi:hypothetical protein
MFFPVFTDSGGGGVHPNANYYKKCCFLYNSRFRGFDSTEKKPASFFICASRYGIYYGPTRPKTSRIPLATLMAITCPRFLSEIQKMFLLLMKRFFPETSRRRLSGKSKRGMSSLLNRTCTTRGQGKGRHQSLERGPPAEK